MKYKDTHKVMSQHTDANGILRVGALLRYMQEAAANCMIEDGPSYDELFGQGYSFVISKIRVGIYADIHANDIIEVETWAGESTRYTYPRYYRILRGGVTVAEASSAWALVDISKRRLVRCGEIPLGYRTDEPLSLDIGGGLRLPEHLSLVGEREVRYSDVDRNRHMNNTVYADMLCDFTLSGEGERVTRMTISFQNEAPLGETLRVYRAVVDENFLVRTQREDGKTNIEAEILTEKI